MDNYNYDDIENLVMTKKDEKNSFIEDTLDPQDWSEFGFLGHKMLEDMLMYLKDIRLRNTYSPTKKAINQIEAQLTDNGEGETKVYEVFKKSILPYVLPITLPKFWGLVAGTGSAYGMLVEMLRAGINGAQEFSFAESYVNAQVIDWIKELLGFKKEVGGVLVSGGSEANFTALAVARNTKARFDVKKYGMQGLDKKMTLYCSDEAHHCLERSVELLGFGSQALKRISTDDNCKIKIGELKRAIKEDKKKNFYPFCVIGCAGTTNSGAFDDLQVLNEIAKKENMWFHIDGAFGAWTKISKTHSHLVRGMENADSLAVDLHKWMCMPYGVGCSIIKDRLAHYTTFVYSHDAEYLKTAFDISEDQLINPHNLALPLSRNFSSLKVYMLLRAYGKQKYSNIIQKNLEQTKYLAGLIKKEECMELIVPAISNIVCFRYISKNLLERDIEKLNKMIIKDINKKNFLMISDTFIKGKYVLRMCNVNHRTKKEDIDFLIKEIIKFGDKNLRLINKNKDK